MTQFILCLLLGTVAVSCTFGAKERSANQHYRVLLPWGAAQTAESTQDSEPQYSLQVVTLKTLQNLTAVQGSTASFSVGYLGPNVRAQVFERPDGVYVPVDSTSQQALALYAHFEKLRELDEKVGAGQVIQRPLIVGINVKVALEGQPGYVDGNAMYSPKHTAIFFSRFSSANLPSTVNAGIIAHEYFHAIFDQMVLRPLKQSMPVEAFGESAGHVHGVKPTVDSYCPSRSEKEKVTVLTQQQLREIYHVRLLRAINEGLADVWGWIYSGDVDFVGRSHPLYGQGRRLDADQGPISSFRHFFLHNQNAGICGRYSGQGFVYGLGTQYAHWLKQAFRDTDRTKLGQIVVAVLPELKEMGTRLAKQDQYMSPSMVIELFAKQVRMSHPEICNELLSRAPRGDFADPHLTCGEPK